MENQFVIFELGLELFGVNIASVESIIKFQAITKIPHAPDFVEGVINLRGKVLPVIDLRKRLGLPLQAVEKKSRIIIVNAGRSDVGMIVDGVSEVDTVPDQAIEPAPAITNSIDSAFITGIAKLDGRLIILLDLEQILSTREQDSLLILEDQTN